MRRAGPILGVAGILGSSLAVAQEAPRVRVPDGFTVELAAGSPLVERPIKAAFDDRGRLYVADSAGVNASPEELLRNPPHVLRRLDPGRAPGRFEKSVVFADKMTYPQGIAWSGGAVFACSPPALWRLSEIDGRRQELLTGFFFDGLAADLHGPTVGPDGRIYWGIGRFEHEIRRPGGPVLLATKMPRIMRCRPDGGDLESFSGAMGNPAHVAFSAEGEVFAAGTFLADGDGGLRDALIHCVEGGAYQIKDRSVEEHKRTGDLLPPLVHMIAAAPAGLVRYQSAAFGPEYRDNLFSAQFNTHRIQRHVLERDGATFKCRTEDFAVAEDTDVHFTDVLEDADGSLLLVNTGAWFFNGCPASGSSKPEVKGSIYRVRRKDAPPAMDPWGQSLPWNRLSSKELATLLDDERFKVRDRAIAELAKSATPPQALRDAALKGAPTRLRLGAVWALARMDRPEARSALRAALADRDLSVRVAAAHSCGLARDPDSMPALLEMVRQDMPAARREAAAALGRIKKPAAAPALLEAVRSGADRFLEHAAVFALIEIRDPKATIQGLKDPSPGPRRAALLALDQMEGANLTADLVTGNLDSSEPGLYQAALAVMSRHPNWSRDMLGYFRRWLGSEQIDRIRQEEFPRQLAAFSKDAGIQELVTSALQGSRTSSPMRILILESIAQTPLAALPDGWARELVRHVAHRDERVARQAVAAVRAKNVPGAHDALLSLARDKSRSPMARVEALAAGPAPLEPALFDFLLSCLEKKQPPVLRLSASETLGRLKLPDAELETLTRVMAAAGALEMPGLIGAYSRSSNPEVGRKLLAALDSAPGLASLTPETLQETLQGYPDEVRRQAEPLVARLKPDLAQRNSKLDELETHLPSGNAARGRDVFFAKKSACTSCHTIQGQGGWVGPELTKIGSIRSARDLLEAIVFPSASFARGYEPRVITTRDGAVLSGIVSRETPEALYLYGADRLETRVPKHAIAANRLGRVSIMPQGLDADITKAELLDLVVFLGSLK